MPLAAGKAGVEHGASRSSRRPGLKAAACCARSQQFQIRALLAIVFTAVTLSVSASLRAADVVGAPETVAAGLGGHSRPQWPNYNNDYAGQRFSALSQIGRSNVASLTEVCRVQVGDEGSFQTGPIVIDDTMYLTTVDDTIALDSKDCSVKWKFRYQSEEREVYGANRGAAFYNGRLFRGTVDGRVIAINAETGKLLWKNVSADPSRGEFFSSAPVAWDGLVFIGTAGSDWGVSGRIMAFDAATGRQVWQFHTVPSGNESGADSWKNAASAKTGGGGTWSSFSLDVSSGELFVPVGNPAPDIAVEYRPGLNLYTDSVLVLDAQSGALKWWYQLVPHDGLDQDLGAAPMLFRNSSQRDMVAAAGKDGFLHVIDRETRKLKFKVATTTIKNFGKTASAEGQLVCPGPVGGTEWNGPAFDRINNTILVGSVDMCATYKTGAVKYVAGDLFYGGSFEVAAERSGWVSAVDADTGQMRWRYHADTPIVAAITPTAGGVVFTGDVGGDLIVLDGVNGAVLKKIAMGGAMAGGVITYQSGGKQYLAVTSGNTSRASVGGGGVPTVTVFAARDPAAADVALVAPGDAARGKAIFYQSCAGCHGLGGDALPAHDLRHLAGRMTAQQILSQIERPKPPMPSLFPTPLNSANLGDVLAYLQTL